MTTEEKEIIFGDIVTSTDIFGKQIPDDIIVGEEPKKVEEVKVEKKEEKVEDKVEEDNKDIFDKQFSSGAKIEEPKKEVEVTEDETDWNAAYQTLVATGEWDEVEIEGEDKTIDEKTFKQLAKQQKERSKDKLLEVLSQDEKDFLAYKKNGGDVPAFVKFYSFVKQAEAIDITTDQGKKQAIYSYYKNFVGWDDAEIDKYIKQTEKDLELDEKAEKAKTKIEDFSKQQFEQVKKQADDAATVRQKAEDDFKETVKTNLKEKKYDTKKSNMIVRDFTDRDERGYTEIDKKYLELRNNPQKIDELWLFLMDYENFEKKISQKKVNEKELDGFKKIVFNKKSKNSQPVKVEQEEGELII